MVKQSSIAIYGINYRPEPTGIGPYTAELAEELVKTGSKVRVITTFAHYPQWKVAEGDRRRWRRKEVINGVKVTRLWSHMPRPMTGLQRMLFELSYLGSALFHGPGDADTVVGVIPGLGSGLMAALHGRVRRRRVVIVVQDLAGRGLRQSGLSSARLLGTMVSRAETLLLRAAHRIVVISEEFTAPLVEMGTHRDRIVTLQNWNRTASASPGRPPKESGAPALLLHAGSMGIKQGLQQMIDVAKVAQTRDLSWKFTLVGDGSERPRLEMLAEGLPNVTFVDPVPEGDFPALLGAADILMVFQAPTNVDMSFPSKLSAYFASERPVVAVVPQSGSVANLLLTHSAGLVITDPDPEVVVESLAALLLDPVRSQEYVKSARTHAAANWDRNTLITSWIEAVVGNSASAVADT